MASPPIVPSRRTSQAAVGPRAWDLEQVECQSDQSLIREDIRGFSRTYPLLILAVDVPEVVRDAHARLNSFTSDCLANLPTGYQQDRIAIILKLALGRQREVARGYENSDPAAVKFGSEPRQIGDATSARLALCLTSNRGFGSAATSAIRTPTSGRTAC